MEWQDQYKIGIPIIDTQHKHLFLASSELNDALAKGLRPATIDTCLTQVGFYVARHFAMEEQYMEASSYPGLAEQIDAHRYFTQHFSEIKNDFQQNGLSPNVVKAIQNELGVWLKNHVLGLDQAFGEFYKKIKT